MTAPGRFCCCTGTSDEPLEDCPLTLFDFPSECFALSYRLVLTDVEITWCEGSGADTCTETLSVQVDFELGLNWQVLSTTGLTITSGGTKWTDVRFIVQCMPKGWAEHPDGTSDYMVMYLEFDYDDSGDPCSMNPVTDEEGAIGLYLISPTPRTTADVCVPVGTYTAFGTRQGVGQQNLEPNSDVGSCSEYDTCIGGIGDGICIEAVASAVVTEIT